MSLQYLVGQTITEAHSSDIFAVEATEKVLVTVSGDKSIKCWCSRIGVFAVKKPDNLFGLQTGVLHMGLTVIQTEGFDNKSGRPLVGETWSIAVSPEGDRLASTSYDGHLNVWDLSETEDVRKLFSAATRGDFGMSIAYSSDGTYIATGHVKGALYMYQASNGALVHSLPGQNEAVRAVAFSPGTSLLAAAGDSKVITVYDVKSGEHVASLTGHQGWIFSIDWNETGELLLSSSIDGKVKVWNITRRECVATQSESSAAVWTARWLKNPLFKSSSHFVTAGADKTIRWYRATASE